MRGADPLIVLVPGVGMFSYGKDKQTARVAGEFYVNAINVMRGAEALSTYAPIPEAEKFRIEYWALEEAKLQRLPKPKRLAGRIALVTGGASGIGKATAARLAADGAVRRDRRPRRHRRHRSRRRAGQHRRRRRCRVRRHRRGRRAGGRRRDAPRLRRHRPGRQQRRPLDLQAAARDDGGRLGPPARRHGQGQLPRQPGGGTSDDRPAHRWRHRLHRVQERGLRRPQQRRLQRHQGRPSPPGPPPRRGARRARHPRERRQPRRRGQRQRHLRRRVGRRARRPVRRAARTSSAPSTRNAPS